MAAGFEAPLVDLELPAPGAGGDPGGAGQHLGQFAAQEVEDAAPHRQGIGDAEHELHVRRVLEQALLHQVGGVVEHGEVEDFDLGLDVVVEHGLRQALDEVGRVLVDAGRKIHRAGGQRGHVGLEAEHGAARGLLAAAAAGGKLDDHARAVLAHAVLHLGELLGVGAGRFVGVAHVDVHQRGAGIEAECI